MGHGELPASPETEHHTPRQLAKIARCRGLLGQPLGSTNPVEHGAGAIEASARMARASVRCASRRLRLNPHLHVVFLDGAYLEQGSQLAFRQLDHLGSRHVG